MAFCGNCGTQAHDDERFCPSCGKEIRIVAAAQTQNNQYGIPMESQLLRTSEPNVRKQNRFLYTLPCFINGLLSLIFGAIGRIYSSITITYGVVGGSYAIAVNNMKNAVDRLNVLLVIGALLITMSLIFSFVKTKENRTISKILWFVPLGLVLLYSVINYIPIIHFATTEWF